MYQAGVTQQIDINEAFLFKGRRIVRGRQGLTYTKVKYFVLENDAFTNSYVQVRPLPHVPLPHVSKLRLFPSFFMLRSCSLFLQRLARLCCQASGRPAHHRRQVIRKRRGKDEFRPFLVSEPSVASRRLLLSFDSLDELTAWSGFSCT